jgi:TetR/AcrR family transcriptional regulator, fatty acid metabolism regulator protein
MLTMSSKEPTKREIIMNAAIKVFAAKGYHSCRTLDISKEAGVAYGSLYQYFKSKDDILLSIFIDSWNSLLQKMEKINQTEDSPICRIIKIFDFMFKNYQQNHDLMKVMTMDIPMLNQFYGQESQELYYRFFRGLAEIVAEGQKRGVFSKGILPIIASFVIYGAVDSAIRQYVYNSEFDRVSFPIEDAKNQITKLLIPGYLTKESNELPRCKHRGI